MSAFKPKITEAYIYGRAEDKIFVVIPEGVPAPDSMCFFYADDKDERSFRQDHEATVEMRIAMKQANGSPTE